MDTTMNHSAAATTYEPGLSGQGEAAAEDRIVPRHVPSTDRPGADQAPEEPSVAYVQQEEKRSRAQTYEEQGLRALAYLDHIGAAVSTASSMLKWDSQDAATVEAVMTGIRANLDAAQSALDARADIVSAEVAASQPAPQPQPAVSSSLLQGEGHLASDATGYATGAGAGGDLHVGQGAPEGDALQASEREAFEPRRLALVAASQNILRAAGAAIHISALVTWSPDRLDEADRLVAQAARHLADFRDNLSVAVRAGHLLDGALNSPSGPGEDLGELYGSALDRVREVHRQTGAMVALLESDMGNTPALVAMSRSIDEAQMYAAVACQGLALTVHELGMAR